MLRLLFGVAVAGATYYGTKRLLENEEYMEKIKDTIEEGAIKAYERIEKLEEKFKLNEYTVSDETSNM
jgi:hypothetical protein